MADETFDFGAFMRRASNPDDETTKDFMREAITEQMDQVFGEVAPRLWCVLQEQMKKAPTDNVYLNAVMNSAIFALFAWLAACTPRGQTAGVDNDEALRSKILANIDIALAADRSVEHGRNLSTLAANVGKLKLMEDSLSGVSQTLVMNSLVIKAIHAYIEKERGK